MKTFCNIISLCLFLFLLTAIAPFALADGGVFAVPEASPATLVAAIFGVLWAVSEALSFIPAVKANGIFQAFFNILKLLAGR